MHAVRACGRKAKCTSFVAAMVCLLFAGGSHRGFAQQVQTPQTTESGQQTPDLQLPADSVTKGSVLLRSGQRLPFTAEAGLLAVAGTDAQDLEISAPNTPLKRPSAGEEGDVAAMSYVAYFADGVDQRKRPIIFLYDGGPSISTRTMLVASFGPIVADLPGLQPRRGGPYSFGNNPDSLLDVADLVFIDPPGTGYGRIRGRTAAHTFYGIDGDAAAFDRFIRRFLTRYSRWESPKYLFGHSYGTVRSVVLARMLQEDSVDLNGIIASGMLLNVVDFPDAASGLPGTDGAYVLQLSTFAATAWFHHKIGTPTRDLQAWLDTVERYAEGPYAEALMAGSNLPAEEEAAVAEHLGQLTGVPKDLWIKAHLRLQASQFEAMLLSDEGQIVGRQDTRYVAPALHPLSTQPGFDASSGKSAAVQAVLDTYMHGTLKFGIGMNYQQDADIPGQWDIFHVSDPSKPWLGIWNVLPDLANVITRNQSMRMLVMGGYYDLATPYQAGLFQMRHLPAQASLNKNITYAVFPTGHEPYLDTASRRSMHDLVAKFLSEGA